MNRRSIGLFSAALAVFALSWLGARAHDPSDSFDAARAIPDAIGVVPVWRLPVVTPISKARAMCGCKDDKKNDCSPPGKFCIDKCQNENNKGCDKKCTTFYFEKPAHFPLPRFTQEGMPVEVEGALIYEGMSVTFYRDGVFETNFIVTSAAHPVTLRLSLHVQPPLDSECQPFQLTIPPVLIQTDERQERGLEQYHWHVKYVGYSPFIGPLNGKQVPFCNAEAIANKLPCTINRRGTARFGYEPWQFKSIYQY
jgi:hypothetical protein